MQGTVRSAANSLSEFSKHTSIGSKLSVFATCSCARFSERSRPEHATGPARQLHEEDNLPQTSKKHATSATATSAETSTSRGTLDDLAERLGNLHESARAPASCLRNHDVSRKTDQSMIQAAKCLFHKLLEKASDDLARVASQPRESLHAEATRDKRRCSRSETPSEKPCSHPETLTNKLRSRFEMPSDKAVWRTSTDTPMPRSSSESLEQVVEGDPRKQLELSVPQYEPGEEKYEFKMSSFTTIM